MKHLLLTTIAAVVLVGCGESQQSTVMPEAKPTKHVSELPVQSSNKQLEAIPLEPLTEANKLESSKTGELDKEYPDGVYPKKEAAKSSIINESKYIDHKYSKYIKDLDIDNVTRELFFINASRFEKNVLSRMGYLKNPLWSIHINGYWPIYFHFEEWKGPVRAEAVTNLRNEYERIANDWLRTLNGYDPDAPDKVTIKIFGFVFQKGIVVDRTFYKKFGNYPIVTNYNLTNEESPWEIQFRKDNTKFDQNWYNVKDYLSLKVVGNRGDLPPLVKFSPSSWKSYLHPEGIDMFFTKFWHRVSWDAVAQRQYLKIGGVINNYQKGETNYEVFAHEMGHCFFLDDIYDIAKYPNGKILRSIMNNEKSISNFDVLSLRMVWELQKKL